MSKTSNVRRQEALASASGSAAAGCDIPNADLIEYCASIGKPRVVIQCGLYVYSIGQCPHCGTPLQISHNGIDSSRGWNVWHSLTGRRKCEPQNAPGELPGAEQK